MVATPDDRPTLLVVGQSDPMQHALEAALARYALVEGSTKAEEAVAGTLAAAPDAVVLIGKAAENHNEVLRELGRHPVSAVVPVVLLSSDTSLTAKLDAVSRGVGVVPRTASVDGMARAIVRSAVSLADDESSAFYEAASVDEIIEIVRRELGGGVLSLKNDKSATSMVVKPGHGVDQAIRDFVTKLRPMVSPATDQDDDLSFEFHGGSKGRFGILDGDSAEGDLSILKGRRLLLIEENPARADHMAQELRAHGALVAVVDDKGTGLERARTTDPEIVLMSEHLFNGDGVDVIGDIRRDPLLRWASSLVVRHEDFALSGQAPRTDRLAGSIAPLLTVDRELRERAMTESSFDTRLEPIGPSRMLRALSSAGKTLHVTARHSRVVVEIDLAEGVVAGAEAVRMGDATGRFGGLKALAALLAVGSARVSVERREHPASANLLMPLDEALIAASIESAPIRPSIPAVSQGTTGPVIPGAPKVPNLKVPNTKRAIPRTAPPKPPAPIKPPKMSRSPKAIPKTKAPKSIPVVPKPAASIAPPTPPVAKAAKAVSKGSPPKRSAPKRVKTMVFGSRSIVPVEAAEEKAPNNETPKQQKPTPQKRPVNDPDRTGPWDSLNETDIPAAPVPTEFDFSAGVDPLAQTMAPGSNSIAAMIEESANQSDPTGLLARATVADELTPIHEDELSSGSTPAPIPFEVAGDSPSPVLPAPVLGEELPTRNYKKWLPWILGALMVMLVSVCAWSMFSGDEETQPVANNTTVEPVDPPAATKPVVRIDSKPPKKQPVAEVPAVEPPTAAVPDETTDAVGEEKDNTPAGRVEALLKAANYHRGAGNLKRSKALYEKALRIRPRSGRVLAGLVRVTMAQGNRQGAVSWARRLVQARPSAPNFTLYGDALGKSGQSKAACGAYTRALSLNRKYKRAKRRKAKCR